MRTTVDISPDLLDRIRKLADDEGVSFKEALSRVITRGLTVKAGEERPPLNLPTFNVGFDRYFDLRRINQVHADEDTAEFVRKFYPNENQP